MKRRKSNTFDCPECGNPLIKSKQPMVRCIYCKRLVEVPRHEPKKKGASH